MLMPIKASAFDIAVMEGDNFSARLAPLMVELYKSIGIEAAIMEAPGFRTLEVSNGGGADAELVRVVDIEREYPNLVKIPVPIFLIKGHVVGIAEKCAKNTSLNDLIGQPVGLTNGISWSNEFAKKLHIRPVWKKDNASLLSGLVGGEYDCALIANDVLDSAKKGLFSNFDLRIAFPNVYQKEAFHYIHRRHQNLLPQLEAAMEIAAQNGRLPLR